MLKKLFALILSISLASGLFCACAERRDEPVTAEAEVSESVEQERVPEFFADDVTPDENLYSDVLNKYYRALNHPDEVASYISADSLSNLLLETPDLEDVGYVLEDLDGDGVEELFIASLDEDSDDIYAMYKKNTVGTGEVFTSSLRARWYLSDVNDSGNFILANYTADGAQNVIMALYEYISGEYKMISGIGNGEGGTWFDIATGSEVGDGFAESYIKAAEDGFKKPDDLIAFSEFEPDPDFDEDLPIENYVPKEVSEAVENAPEDALIAVFVNPSDALITYFGVPERLDVSEDIVAVISLKDKVLLTVDSDDEELSFETTLNAKSKKSFFVDISAENTPATRTISAVIDKSEDEPVVWELVRSFDPVFSSAVKYL